MMKHRLGFVSNSSSCSFTCPVCDNSWEGWDWDEPICSKCGTNSSKITESFVSYLIREYYIDEQRARENFKIDQEKKYKNNKRQEFIAEYGRAPND